ncbi:MAG: glycosyltransferase family 39 protein [Flavobacteriaceae bacterium]|nr:glycosyltransferase family 39 protein [Flavobacteriaceae bacterium]
MIKTIENNPILTIVVVVLIMLSFNIDVLDVSIMEARNFITAREMITDNNWLLTTMNGEARYQKPPLPTWFAALSGLIFGIKNILALRFPGIIMVILTGVYSYLLSNTLLKNKGHSLINGLLTVTSFYVIGIVIEAPWDIFSHGFMLIGIFHLFQLFEKQKKYWQHTLLAGLFIGFSFMCKGPVSFYALLIPFLISYGIIFKYKHFRAKLFSVFSILILILLVGGWWFLYVRLEDPQTFLNITNKETGNWGSYNVRPFYYYWSFFTQSGIWTIPAFISLLYPYLKSRVSNLKAYKFSFYWTIFAVILLSIIPEKKSRYLMPVLIPLAINTGFYIEYLIREFKNIKDKRETVPVYFNFGLIALIGIVFPFAGYLFLKDYTNANWALYTVAVFILLSIGIAIIVQLKRKNINSIFYLTICFMIGVFVFVLPLSKALKSDSYKSISQLKTKVEKENLKVYSFGFVSPEMIWNFGDKIPQIKINDSTYNFPKENKFGILVNGFSPADTKLLKENYTIVQYDTYDLNRSAPGTKNYKKRLLSHYYVLTKK